MKRLITLLLIVTLCFSLEACGGKAELVHNTQATHTPETLQKETMGTESGDAAAPKETTAVAEEPIQLNYELIGPWHLDGIKNDLAAFADSLELFPGYGEWGASMEIRGNGEMSWYIGAEGWHGTYFVEGNTLHGLFTSDLEQSPKNWEFRITTENGIPGLEMDDKGMTIYWVYGDQEDTVGGNTLPANWEKATVNEPWKAALAEDLFEKYGVRPEYYEDLGDGIYLVYVEVGGEILPFAIFDAVTEEYSLITAEGD